jgi:3-oxoacyl-[acyl-carrier protein] reductase
VTQQVAFISGGGSGLGKATVLTLLDDGWSVAFTYYQSEQGAESIVNLAAGTGREVLPIRANLLEQAAAHHAATSALQYFGQVDAFVHNFGPFVFERKRLAEYSDDEFEEMFTGNLRSFWWLYRVLVPSMRERGFGRIVTLGSEGAGMAVGWGGRAPYAAAKAGLASLTRSVAREEREFGVTANMVCPGDVRGKKKELLQNEADAALPERTPVGGDVARVVSFYCQPASHQLNGTVTEVNGGTDVRFLDEHSGQDEDG